MHFSWQWFGLYKRITLFPLLLAFTVFMADSSLIGLLDMEVLCEVWAFCVFLILYCMALLVLMAVPLVSAVM